MENSFDNLVENIADFTASNSLHSYFFSHLDNAQGPGDGDEETGEGEDGDKGEGNDDENPPLDPNIVHSPVPPQTGGKPPATKTV